MTGVGFAVVMAALAGGVVLSLASPGRGWPRRLSLFAAFVGCLAGLAVGVDALSTSTSWTWHSDTFLQPLGGVSLKLDSLGAFFLIIVVLTGAPASLYGLGYLQHLDGPRGRALHALFNIFLAGMCLVAAADNGATFLFAWELMAVSSYLLVVSDASQRDGPAAGLWYAVMTHAGFLALLMAFVILAQGGPMEFGAMRIGAATLTPGGRTAVFLLTVAAFGSKAGLVPLHVWLPRAHPAAPSHVSALMSAAMVKLGVYGTIRLLFDLLPPEAPPWWGGALLTAGVVTALTGVLYSVAETHLKRVLAYSTVENVGLIFVGVGFALLMRGYGYSALSAMGLLVALLHTLNHAAFKSLLFLAGGAVVHGTGATSLEAFGGLVKRMPYTAVLCLVGVLGLAAVPPLNGFPSEWLTFQLLVAGARYTAPTLAITLPLALAGVALVAGLAAVSAVRLFGITFLALPRTEGAAHAHEVPVSMRAGMALPAAACVALGLFPTVALTQLAGITSDLGLPMEGVDTGLALALPLVGSRLWPVAIAALVAGTAILAAAVSRAPRSARRLRIDIPWNCGRLARSPRSEYTAAAFAEPLKRVFTGFYRPTQEVTVDVHPVSQYFVRTIKLRTDLAPWMEEVIYGPVVATARRASTAVSRIQTGSLHLYLALLAGGLLALLVIARWIP